MRVFLLRVTKAFKRELAVLMAVSAIANLLMLLPTIYMLQIFDRIMISKNELTLLIVSLITLGLYGVQAFSEWIRGRLINACSVRLDQQLSGPVFHAIFQDRLKGNDRNALQALSDLTAIRQWLTGSGLFAFLDGPWTPVYLTVMFVLHPVLGALTIAVMLLLTGFAFLSTKTSQSLSEATQDEERELNDFLYNKLRNAEVIEAHGMVPNFKARWWQRQVGFLSLQAKSEDVEERFTASSKQLRFLVNSLAIAVGAILAIEGEITMGAMIAAGLLMGRATAPIDALVGGWRSFSMARLAVQRVETLMEENPIRSAASGGVECAGLVELHQIHAWAQPPHGGRVPILNGIDLQLVPGQVSVVLGPSGAGKSTLGKVLMGIWPNQSGAMLLDGRPVSELDTDALGALFGYCPQTVGLFHGTVAENIARMGRPDPTQVIEAAKLAGMHEFILRLPKGYDTILGEPGGHLSGGQRQRVALARAVYGSPKLLVLDEPNASLDEAGEASLLQIVRTLKERACTVVLISHRPSVLAVADRVICISAGQVAFDGSVERYQKEFNS
jgi:ATP-binding cassette subfamily C exporter for protease/lipase